LGLPVVLAILLIGMLIFQLSVIAQNTQTNPAQETSTPQTLSLSLKAEWIIIVMAILIMAIIAYIIVKKKVKKERYLLSMTSIA